MSEKTSAETEQIADEFEQAVAQLMKKHGISSLVMDVAVRPGELVSIWLPGCAVDCPHPNTCLAANLQLAAENLMSVVEQMEEDGEIEGSSLVH